MPVRLVAVTLALLLAACSIDRRSDQYRCGNADECEPGRRCESGWCVIEDGTPGADGGADAFLCPKVCDECIAGVCVFVCRRPNDCANRIVCPPGVPCRIHCDGKDSCGGGVDCTAATGCDVECVAPGACQGSIACGNGRCRIACTLNGTCTGGVDCQRACACDVTCSGTGACDPEASCPDRGTACDSGGGCVSAPDDCATCS